MRVWLFGERNGCKAGTEQDGEVSETNSSLCEGKNILGLRCERWDIFTGSA